MWLFNIRSKEITVTFIILQGLIFDNEFITISRKNTNILNPIKLIN